MSVLIEQSTFGAKTAVLSNGVKLPYVEDGDPTGLPLVLLHGLSDSWHSYEPVLPFLPPSIRAFALTLRGHGDADRPDEGYTPTDMAEDVAHFAEATGIGPAVVVGHSMGSTVAQQFAIDHPSLTRGLVLIGSFVDFAANPTTREFNEAVAQLTDPVDSQFAQEFQEATLAHPVPPAFLDLVVAESLKLPLFVWKDALEGLMVTNLSRDLERITAPALLIWGERDAFAPGDEQDYLASVIRDARLAIYEDTGHAVHWEQPARVAADIVAFVEQLTG